MQAIPYGSLTLHRRLVQRGVVSGRQRAPRNHAHRRFLGGRRGLRSGLRQRGNFATVGRAAHGSDLGSTEARGHHGDAHFIRQLRIDDGSHHDGGVIRGELFHDVADFLELADRQVHARGDVHEDAVRALTG